MARAFAPGAKVAEVAREADVCTSLRYRWRQAHLATQAGQRIGFAPAVLVEPADLGRTIAAGAEPAITVALPGGVQVKVDATAPEDLV